MDSHTRHVSTLRLRARDETLVRRGAVLVTDALRTASFPDDNGRRLLLVRRLALGRVHPDRGSSHVALAIERELWQLGSSAIHASDPAAAAASAVYFHDTLDAHVALAEILARGQRPTAWFWRLAVSGWQVTQTRDEALVAVLSSTLDAECGVAAAAVFVEELARRGVVDPLFGALGAQHGMKLLALSAWTRPSVASGPSRPARANVLLDVAPPLRDAARRWIGRWGPIDARSLWLSALGLVAGAPARLLDARLLERALQVIAQVGEDIPASLRRDIPIAQAERDAGEASASGGVTGLAPMRLPTSSSDPIDPIAVNGQGAVVAERQVDRSLLRAPLVDSEEAPDDDGAGVHAASPPAHLQRAAKGAVPTQYAGLFFLLAVLERLKIREFLTVHPDLIDVDLPRRVLRAVADRLDIPADDAVRIALRAPVPASPAHIDFQAPNAWLGPLCDPHRFAMARVVDRDGVRVLVDASGRLPLALWCGRTPEVMRARFAGEQIVRAAALTAHDGLELLVSAWIVAMRRWCRRFAHLGLSSAVGRAGRVASSGTHLDVMLDPRHADVKVRRAGLDLNPGWIPWFGRVVQFHYGSGETRDA